MKYFLIMLTIMGCSKFDKKITSIKINNNYTSEINLFEGTYNVKYYNKRDSIIEFNMSKQEIQKIKELYNKNKINNYGENVLIIENNKSLTMPATDIIYEITFLDGTKQNITIRTDFNSDPLKQRGFEHMQNFIGTINSILNHKKEISTSARSDYMHF